MTRQPEEQQHQQPREDQSIMTRQLENLKVQEPRSVSPYQLKPLKDTPRLNERLKPPHEPQNYHTLLQNTQLLSLQNTQLLKLQSELQKYLVTLPQSTL